MSNNWSVGHTPYSAQPMDIWKYTVQLMGSWDCTVQHLDILRYTFLSLDRWTQHCQTIYQLKGFAFSHNLWAQFVQQREIFPKEHIVLIDIRSSVRLRIRKSISGHCFQTTRKFDDIDLQYHRDVIFSV